MDKLNHNDLTLGQKIRSLIKARNYKKIEDFYLTLKDFFGGQAITRRTLTRLLKDRVAVTDRTLNQIAIILDVPTSSLRQDSAPEGRAASTFQYNKDAMIEGLRKDLPFAPERLTLKRNGRTSREQDRADAKQSIKWFVVARGAVTLVVEEAPREERKTFMAGEEFAFDARKAHYFESAHSRVSVVYIVHYPVENSDLFLFEREVPRPQDQTAP